MTATPFIERIRPHYTSPRYHGRTPALSRISSATASSTRAAWTRRARRRTRSGDRLPAHRTSGAAAYRGMYNRMVERPDLFTQVFRNEEMTVLQVR
jgi:hypothetical protein